MRKPLILFKRQLQAKNPKLYILFRVILPPKRTELGLEAGNSLFFKKGERSRRE